MVSVNPHRIRIAALIFASAATLIATAPAMSLQEFHDQVQTRTRDVKNYVKNYIRHSVIDQQTDQKLKADMTDFFLRDPPVGLEPKGLSEVMGFIIGIEAQNVNSPERMNKPNIVEKAICRYVKMKYPKAVLPDLEAQR